MADSGVAAARPMGLACRTPKQCVMRQGAIVRYVGTWHKSKERGIVQWAHGAGEPGLVGPPLALNDAIIKIDTGHHLVTNIHDEWEAVPGEELTSSERVSHAWMTYEPPTWDDPSEQHSLEFRVVAALLTPAEHERVFNDHSWPTSFWELIHNVAAEIDDRVKAARTSGTAMARLEAAQ
jgi:hypothetical protein